MRFVSKIHVLPAAVAAFFLFVDVVSAQQSVLSDVTDDFCAPDPSAPLSIQDGFINKQVIEHAIWLSILSTVIYQEEEVCEEMRKLFRGEPVQNLLGFLTNTPLFGGSGTDIVDVPTEIINSFDSNACEQQLQFFSQQQDHLLNEIEGAVDYTLVYTRPIADGNENVCYVVGRGTDMESFLQDWEQNLDFTTRYVPQMGRDNPEGQCHAYSGFIDAFMLGEKQADLDEAVKTCVESCVHETGRNCQLFTSGHSQGGAIGAIAAAYYSDYDPFIISFAQPRTFASGVCDRLDQHRYLRIGNTDGFSLLPCDGRLYDPIVDSFQKEDRSGHFVLVDDQNNGGVTYYPPFQRADRVYRNFAKTAFSRILDLHDQLEYTKRTVDLWKFVKNDGILPVRGWADDVLCNWNSECIGDCKAPRLFGSHGPRNELDLRRQCEGGGQGMSQQSTSLFARCRDVTLVADETCSVDITASDVDFGSTFCARKDVDITSIDGLGETVVTLTTSLGDEMATCQSSVFVEREEPVVFCNSVVAVPATLGSGAVHSSNIGFAYDPNGVALLRNLVGKDDGIPQELFDQVVPLYTEALGDPATERMVFEETAPEIAQAAGLTDLFNRLFGTSLSLEGNSDGLFPIGEHFVTLVAGENACGKTNWCTTRLIVEVQEEQGDLCSLDIDSIEATESISESFHNLTTALEIYAYGTVDSSRHQGERLLPGGSLRGRSLFVQFLPVAALVPFAGVGLGFVTTAAGLVLPVAAAGSSVIPFVTGGIGILGSGVLTIAPHVFTVAKFGLTIYTALRRRRTTRELKESINTINEMVGELKVALETGLARIEDLLEEGFTENRNIVLDEYILALSGLEVNFVDFFDSLEVDDEAVQAFYESRFRNGCNSVDKDPFDIFRFFYGHSCKTCDNVTGGTRALSYFMDSFKEAAAGNRFALQKFRQTFGSIVLSALSRALFLHMVCLPSAEHSNIDRCQDIVWQRRSEEMAMAIAEVTDHLNEAEEEVLYCPNKQVRLTKVCTCADLDGGFHTGDGFIEVSIRKDGEPYYPRTFFNDGDNTNKSQNPKCCKNFRRSRWVPTARSNVRWQFVEDDDDSFSVFDNDEVINKEFMAHNWYFPDRCGFYRVIESGGSRSTWVMEVRDDDDSNDVCFPAIDSNDGDGGWYDLRGCGKCNDYCRWVDGTTGSPDDDNKLRNGHWSCKLSGFDAYTEDPNWVNDGGPGTEYLFPTGQWLFTKCSGPGADAP